VAHPDGQGKSLVHELLPGEGRDGLRVSFIGCVDERADFEPLLAQVGSADVVLDLAGIDAMNSAGISRWILFLEQLTSTPGRRVMLKRCSFHGFVMPATMITSMMAGASIASVQLLFSCDCSEELDFVSSWVDVDASRVCRRCNGARTLDVSPDLLEPLLGPRRG